MAVSDILKLAALAHVHVNVARRHERQRQLAAHTLQLRESLAIPPFPQQLDGEPDIAGKELLTATRLRSHPAPAPAATE